MGSVLRRAVRNILEIPLDVLVPFLGRGFKRYEDEEIPQMEISIGKHLKFDESEAIALNDVPDESQSEIVRHVSDVRPSLSGRQFSLTKLVGVYKLNRNADGLLVNVVKLREEEEVVDLTLPDGYNSGVDTPLRAASASTPSFYKKP